MIHLYIFNEGSRASVYGIGTYMRQIVECFSQVKDISLHVVQLRSDKKEFEIEQVSGYRTFFFPGVSNNSFQNRNPQRYYQNIWLLLESYIQLRQDDQIVFHLNYFHASPLINLFRKDYTSCKVVFAIHYQNWCFSLKGNTSYFKKIIHMEKELLSQDDKQVCNLYEEEKKVLQSVDKVICLAKYTQQLMVEEFGIEKEKTALILNGLNDEGKLLSEEDKTCLKKKYFFSENEKIILFVGRLTEIKGPEVLIKAFKLLIEECPNFRLLIAGDGDFSTYLKEIKGCWNKITFLGHLNKDDLFQFYQIADVGVMPSTHEQCSYVAIEMMMFGLPLIISTSTGLSEMIDEVKHYKLLVAEENDKVSISEIELKDRIIDVLSDKEYKNYMRIRYQKWYDIKKMRNRYITIYEKLFE